MSVEIIACSICGLRRAAQRRRAGNRCRDCMRYAQVVVTEADALTNGHWRNEPGGIKRWIAYPVPIVEPIRCGTYRGYRRHRRNGEDSCAGCREAFRIHRRNERAEARKAA